VAFVDVIRKPPAPTELLRFARRFGARSLMDDESPIYRDGGFAYLTMDEDEVLERVLRDPRLLRLPLVRAGARLSIGVDEDAWRSWLGS
jgi:arsenate reductase-like glutaredoxin family protein